MIVAFLSMTAYFLYRYRGHTALVHGHERTSAPAGMCLERGYIEFWSQPAQ